MASDQSKYRGKKEYHIIYSELINAARYRGTVTYQEIAMILGLPLKGSYMGSVIGGLLGDISEDEVNEGRPMLSAVAVGVSGIPGKGFYGLAHEHGKEFENTKEGRLKFWEDEKQTVYETWKIELKPSK
jgi:hypothetical protein